MKLCVLEQEAMKDGEGETWQISRKTEEDRTDEEELLAASFFR